MHRLDELQSSIDIFQMSVMDTEKLWPMFCGLTILEIHPYVATSDNGLERAEQRHNLGTLLQKAKKLRVLSSSRWYLEDLHGSEEPHGARTDFRIFLGKIWPRLTKLELKCAWVEASDLMSIIRAHSGSLRELTLDDISLLNSEGWEQIGKEIGQILELHHVRFRKSYYYPSSTDLKRDLALVRDMMRWAPPDLPEIEEKYGLITGRVKAGSSWLMSDDTQWKDSQHV